MPQKRRNISRALSNGHNLDELFETPIERIHGIVNGTTNFILTEMAGGSSYAEALAEAQRSGYAEADPSDDVSGRDAAAKMAILARLAFGTPVHLDDVRYEGIEPLRGRTSSTRASSAWPEADRHRRAPPRRALGARASRVPVLRSPARGINGSFNAVTVESETITEITLSGPGAGAPDRERGARRRRQRDDRRRAPAGAAVPLELVADVETRSTCTSRSPTSPGCSRR